MDIEETLKNFISENYWSVTITIIMLSLSLIWVVIISGRHKKRFLTWKKEKINLWIYSNEREYSKDDLMQELFDENVRLEKENKILKKQVSDSSFLGIIILFIILIILWFKRNKNDMNEPDNNSTDASRDALIETENNNCDNATTK